MDTKTCEICGEQVEKRKAGPHKSVHVRQAKARYKYFNGDTKHPYEFKACEECGEEQWLQVRTKTCSYRCSKLGIRNPSKQKATAHGMTPTEYASVHSTVRMARGSAFGCMHCGSTEKRMYHWANLTGNYTDVYDYINLCVPCHDKYDRHTKGNQ